MRLRSDNRFYGHCQNLTRSLVAAYDKALEDYDVLVMPTQTVVALPLPKKDSTLKGILIMKIYCINIHALNLNNIKKYGT